MNQPAETITMDSTPNRALNYDFELPAFPATASNLLAALNQPNVKVASVIELIECEPRLFAQVLQLANSPIYGVSRTITTVGHAVVVLGLEAVGRLAITVATGSVFQETCDHHKMRELTYSQSLAVATVARSIASRFDNVNRDESFLCGVVHDIGKVVLLNSDGAEYSELLMRNPSGNTTPMEQQAFGVTHPSLGNACGKKWGLPESINHAVRNHHQPPKEVDDSLSHAVIVANQLARHWQIGFTDAVLDETESEFIDQFADPATLVDSRAACEEQYAAICEICLS